MMLYDDVTEKRFGAKEKNWSFGGNNTDEPRNLTTQFFMDDAAL